MAWDWALSSLGFGASLCMLGCEVTQKAGKSQGVMCSAYGDICSVERPGLCVSLPASVCLFYHVIEDFSSLLHDQGKIVQSLLHDRSDKVSSLFYVKGKQNLLQRCWQALVPEKPDPHVEPVPRGREVRHAAPSLIPAIQNVIEVLAVLVPLEGSVRDARTHTHTCTRQSM